MSDRLTCLSCGHEGFDVRILLIDIEEPDQRIVEQSVTVGHTLRGPIVEQRQVREAYATEPRCVDRIACRARTAALWPPAPPEPEAPASVPEDEATWAQL